MTSKMKVKQITYQNRLIYSLSLILTLGCLIVLVVWNWKSITQSDMYKHASDKERTLWVSAEQIQQLESHVGVYVYHDVCIEDDVDADLITVSPQEKVSAKKLVVYNSPHTGPSSRVTSCWAAQWPNVTRWRFEHTDLAIPQNYQVEELPAFFTIPSCTGNMWHLWEDLLFGVYQMLKICGMLGLPNSSHLLYKEPWPTSKSMESYHSCYNISRYQEFIFAFGFRADHNIYHRVESATCFKQAIFGWIPIEPHRRHEIADFIINRFSHKWKVECRPRTVTFIKRSTYRRIINLQQLQQQVIKLGFQNTQIVVLEKLTFLQQYEIARCSVILVGINGAGLEWALFMKASTGLLELTFGHLFPALFHNLASQRRLHYMTVSAETVIPDVQALCANTGLTPQQVQQRFTNQTYPFKFANAIYDLQTFTYVFKRLVDKVLQIF